VWVRTRTRTPTRTPTRTRVRPAHGPALRYLLAQDGFVEVPKGTEQGDIEDFAGYAHRMKRRGVAEENLVRLDRKIAVRRQVRWLFKSAENGFVPAMNRLALMFSNGEVPKDTMDELVAKASDDMKADVANRHKQAARWYLAAAQKGDAHAAKQLGNMFIEGVGVDADYKKAMGWLQKAGHKAEESMRLVYDRYKQLADRGNKSAAYQLALMHVDGAGAEKNYKTAVKFNEKAGKLPRDAAEEIANLFQQAAKDGQQDAAYQLALMHMDGVGVDMDYKKALYFLDRAGVDKERSFRQVVDVFTEKAHAGDKRAQYQLGLIYCDGVGVHMDYKTAISWMVKSGESEEKVAHFVADRLMLAANKGNQRSAYQRALMHVDGVGVEMDYKVALDWLEKSGQPVTQAHQQAAQWFRTNAESGDKRSAYQLALMYVDGVGVDMDYKEALEWLRRAGQKDDFAQQLVSSRLQMQAEKRHVPSCKQLALMYMNYKSALTFLEKEGHDEHWYHKQAARWYEVAGEENDESAALTLAQMHVDGVGVPIDFKRATAWFEAGGKDKQFAKKRIDAKLQSLKPKYKMLFDSYAERNGGKVDLVQFAGFYRDCLLAKGLPKDKADQETRGLYQGRPKYEILFQSYDKNRDHSIDFEEIWSHEHTHTSLFPKTGAHVMAANEFFSHFHPLARAQSIQELTQDLNLTGPLSSRARSMGSAGSTLDRARSKRPMSARALTSKGSALALGAFDEGDPDVASPPK
jgi:TPR repeat protein